MATDKKKLLIGALGLGGLFWVLHAVNCFRLGYQDPIGDFANYIRSFQLIVIAISILLLLLSNRQTYLLAYDKILLACTINLFVISAVVVLATLLGNAEPTYSNGYGYLGWFNGGNSQSAILTVLVPLSLLFSYRRKGIPLFILSSVAGFANLFFIGTRVGYYSIFIICTGFLFILWIQKSKTKSFYLVLSALAIINAVLYKQSPMYQSRSYTAHVIEVKQSKADSIVDSSPAITGNTNVPDAGSTNAIEKYRELYEIYLYNTVDRFGLQATLEAYNYTTDVKILANYRIKKMVFAELSWRQTDLITRFLGFEKNTLVANGEIFELENGLYLFKYYYGYIGMAVVVAFMLLVLLQTLMRLKGHFRSVLSDDTGALLLSFALLVGSGIFTGGVFIRPNVSVYLSLLWALLMLQRDGECEICARKNP
jgi:O-antigen ligase